MNLELKLEQGLQVLGIGLDAAARQRLLDFVALLQKWNAVHNLTAVRDADRMVDQHLLDSLAVLPHIQPGRLADVGSGGGLPGIPLAIARPELQVTLIDSSHKKTTFLRQAAAELQLSNVQVECTRVETWQPAELFNTVISRAFSELAQFYALARHLLAPGGVVLAMKGIYPHEEIAQLPPAASVREVKTLTIPGVDAQRHLVMMESA